ncbi:SMC-Scp complex subunit ScpB [Novosphingobium naphthalenivorans]|uniref:SMC-Scp complex subunit ScpB n=1 Tax=Novosphingobium naphthalenivorans TaxID=273168 RepID=UPI000A5C4B66|nr:SMC-Scp complex subunit ScpB [Novosphingobium naphthalenivorans]
MTADYRPSTGSGRAAEGAGQQCAQAELVEAPDDLVRAVEATLFAAEQPMTVEQIAVHLGQADVRPALAELQRHYQQRGIRLVERGKRWHFETALDLAHLLRREKEEPRRLSRAATEVLAIVAYHEPVSRAEIEAIRGVQTAKGTLDVLMEAGWVRVAGRREVPGRPVIYATTPDFLAHFGLKSLKELPGIDELRAAGLLDPVDDEMIEAALSLGNPQDEHNDDSAATGPGLYDDGLASSGESS